MSAAKLKLVSVEFDLPFVLRLVDSIRSETIPAGYEQYFVVFNGVPVTLRFEKKLRDLGGIKIADEDRNGLLSYSSVQVLFDEYFITSYEIPMNYREKMDLLIEISLLCVNHFLDNYRDVTRFYWIKLINYGDVGSVKMVGLLSDGTLDPFTTLTPMRTGVMLGVLLPTQIDQTLREHLKEGVIPDDIQKLAFAALALYEKGEYWSAVLNIEILFEAKVSRMLKIYFESQGLRDAQVRKLFEHPNGETRSITNLLRTYLPTSQDLDDESKEIGRRFKDWYEKPRKMRNEIAHGAQLIVTADQAQDAINAVRVFLYDLERLIPDKAKTEISFETFLDKI